MAAMTRIPPMIAIKMIAQRGNGAVETSFIMLCG
jgi:hypothetical protein